MIVFLIRMKILFILRKARKNAKGECTIQCRITLNGQRCSPFSTNITCRPTNFDSKKQLINGDDLSNTELGNIRQRIRMIHLDLENKGVELTADLLKDYYLGRKSINITLVQLLDKYLIHRLKLRQIGEISHGTYMVDKYFAGNLKKFLKDGRMERITPKEVTPKTLNDFYYWIQASKGAGREYAAKKAIQLKALINFAVIEGFALHNPLTSVRMKKGQKKEPECLTPEQVETLWNYDFKNENLQKVADCMLLQCYTGFAYVDLRGFDPFKHIDVDPAFGEYINKNRQKSGTKSLLPLLPRAKEVINKYTVIKNDIPVFSLKVMSNSDYNKYLKVIEALLNFGVHFTTHIGRRTYGSLRLHSGVDIFRVSKEMGHKNIQETIDNYAVLLRKMG